MRGRFSRHVLWTSIIILIWILVILSYAVRRYLDSSHKKKGEIDETFFLNSNSDIDKFASYSFDITEDNMMSDSHPLHNSGCFLPHVLPNLMVYLAALENSVRIVSLPPLLSSEISGKCASLGSKKKAISSHPHSIELHFPIELKLMAHSDENSDKLGAKDSDKNRYGGRDSITTSEHLHGKNQSTILMWRRCEGQANSRNLFMEPLFYYLEALPYHVIYCNKKSNNREDWTGKDLYWKSVADYVLMGADNADEMIGGLLYHPRDDFMQNMGLDFLIPASHPQSGPSRIHPSSLSYLLRATYLKTDFDIAGSEPKDIIVPYYTVDDDPAALHEELSWCSRYNKSRFTLLDKHNRTKLLFFAGSDNPKDGYRSLFLRQLNNLRKSRSLYPSDTTNTYENKSSNRDIENNDRRRTNSIQPKSFWSFMSVLQNSAVSNNILLEDITDDDEIFFSLSKNSLSSSQYQNKLQSYKYCLILKGDTTSSKRLFSAVSAGCVPVIISDGLKLPFANIINYSSFAVTFPESIVNNIGSLLNYLRQISFKRYAAMRCALSEVRRYLVYGAKYKNSKGLIVKSSINPVTLILIDAFMRREIVCQAMGKTSFSLSTMCQRLMYRLNHARESTRNI